MVLVRKKNFVIFLMEELSLFVSFFALLYLLSLTPEDLTPRYGKMLPFFRLFIFSLFAYSFIRALVWFFREKLITIDFDRMLVSFKNKELSVAGCSVHIILRRRNDEMFYRVEFCPREYFSKYKTPAGYKNNISYKDILKFLDEKGVKYSVSYAPYFLEINKEKWY